jgi:hypothetical protein
MQIRFRPIPGRPASASALVLALVWLLSGCYGFQGGGGFPSSIHTVYIQAFDNQTSQFDLDQQIFAKLIEKLPRALGVRPGGQEIADAIIRGKVVRYDDVAQNYRPADQTTNTDVQVLQHQVTVTISIEVIDAKRKVVIWESQGLSGKGEYVPGAQPDLVGRNLAIENLVQQIVDGAQSQW